jgi:hypothetical protein
LGFVLGEGKAEPFKHLATLGGRMQCVGDGVVAICPTHCDRQVITVNRSQDRICNGNYSQPSLDQHGYLERSMGRANNDALTDLHTSAGNGTHADNSFPSV